MYYILHNTDNEKVTILKDDANFVHFMRNIAVENGDEELSITNISEAMDYFENYCPNLTFLVEKENIVIKLNILKQWFEDFTNDKEPWKERPAADMSTLIHEIKF